MEVIGLLRRRGVHLTAKVFLVSALVITFFNAAAFSKTVDTAVNQNFSSDADVNIFGLIDDLRDPGRFSAFRESAADLERLGAFYNALVDRTDLTFLSSFDQPLPVQEFRGGATFEDGYGTEMSTRGHYKDPTLGNDVFDAKSLQINGNAVDFYNLGVSRGSVPEADSVDYDSGTIPVLLGSHYDGVYDVGDRFTGSLYFKEVTFEVSGLLSPDTSVFYANDINFFLDDYIVVPYPDHLVGLNEQNKEFWGILAFAMVNGDIALSKDFSADDLLARLAAVAASTGFHDYTLLDVSPYLTQFTLTKNLIKDNLGLVWALEGALLLAVVFCVGVLDRYFFRRDSMRYRIAWFAGSDARNIFGLVARPVVVSCAVTAAVVGSVLGSLPQHTGDGFGPLLVVLAILLFADLAHHGILLASFLRTDSRKATRIP